MADFNKENFNLDEYRFGDHDQIENSPELQDYLKIMYQQIKFDNKLAGEFSVYGEYFIPQRMREYLIKEMKFYQERKGDIVYATRVLENMILNFKITFNIIGGSQQAFLDLEERELRFDDDNIIHKTRLAEIVGTNHPDFVGYVYKEWNVLMSGHDSSNLEDNPIMKMFREQMLSFTRLGALLNVSSQIFMMSMLPLLGKSPKGTNILNQFNSILNDLKLKNPLIKKDWLKMKGVLDQVMRKNGFLPELMKGKEFKPVVKDFVNPIKAATLKKDDIEKVKPQTEAYSIKKPEKEREL